MHKISRTMLLPQASKWKATKHKDGKSKACIWTCNPKQGGRDDIDRHTISVIRKHLNAHCDDYVQTPY